MGEEKEGEKEKREVYGGEGDIQMEVILIKRIQRPTVAYKHILKGNSEA